MNFQLNIYNQFLDFINNTDNQLLDNINISNRYDNRSCIAG